MKKKILIASIIVFILLIIPIPTGIYKDGGTREYTALTYKIVKWNRIYSDGTYTKTKIYPFPLNFLSIGSLFNRENVDKTNTFWPETETDQENIPEDTKTQETNISFEEPNVKNLPFEAQYIRTDGYHEDAQYPKVVFVRSVDELNAYYEENKDIYSLGRRSNVYSDSSIGFLDACDKYDNSFFENYVLVMVLLEEGSGSVRHKVNKLELISEEIAGQNVDKLIIDIDPLVPEIGTCDMAEWHILIEVPSSEITNVINDATVYYDGVNVTDKPMIVRSEKEYANISLKLHKNWDYIEYQSEDNTEFGLEIYPKGIKDGKIRIIFSKTPFGVCGTGLTEENSFIAIYDAVIGKYDTDEYWSFIHFKNTPGEYIILNLGADSWLGQYNEELTQILSTLRVGEGFLTQSEAFELADKVRTVENPPISARFDIREMCWYVYCHPKGEPDGFSDPGHQTIKIKVDGSNYWIDPLYLD